MLINIIAQYYLFYCDWNFCYKSLGISRWQDANLDITMHIISFTQNRERNPPNSLIDSIRILDSFLPQKLVWSSYGEITNGSSSQDFLFVGSSKSRSCSTGLVKKLRSWSFQFENFELFWEFCRDLIWVSWDEQSYFVGIHSFNFSSIYMYSVCQDCEH